MAERLISCDDHIDLGQLPADLWLTRLPAALRERAPQLLLAVMPPIVARLAVDGSTGKKSRSLRNSRLSRSSTTPGSTRARRPSTSIPTTRSRYLLQSMTSARATVCPHCDVPPPRANTGTPSSRAIAIAAAASSRFCGTTTPMGSIW
jgi:hypothetical protein